MRRLIGSRRPGVSRGLDNHLSPGLRLAPERRSMSGRRNAPGRQGFALFEVLVAIAVLSAGCVALVQSLTLSLRTFGTLEDRYAAALALEDAAWTMDHSGGVFDPLQYRAPPRFAGASWVESKNPAAAQDASLQQNKIAIEWRPSGANARAESFELSAYYEPSN